MDPVTYEFKLGDCLETLKLISDKSIDIVTTSPPYNIGLKYHNETECILEFSKIFSHCCFVSP